MKKFLSLVLSVFVLSVLAGCPSQPSKPSSDPSGAKARADKAMDELDREMEKRR